MSVPQNPYERPESAPATATVASSHGNPVVAAMGFGCLATFLTYGAAICVGILGLGFPARMLAWPSALLVSLVPVHNIGTPQDPVGEGTPLHVLAWIAGIPLAAGIYALGIYLWLRLRRRRPSH